MLYHCPMVPSAGAMFSTHTFRSQSTSRPSAKRTNSSRDTQEPRKKPKKVNSEIRKQQNRIASRNYREKRKRKLQYLQQLLKDGESPEQAEQAAEEAQREGVVTPDHHTQRPLPTFTLPSNAPYPTLASTSSNMINPVFTTTAAPFENHLSRTSSSYQGFENSWSTSMYDSPPAVNISAWNVPTWMPSIDFTPTGSSRTADYQQYTPPPQTHHGYEQLPTPPQQSRTPDSDLYVLGSYGQCRRPESEQPTGISHVSLPSSAPSSPFNTIRYSGVP